jgi:hypothetical protein
MNNLEGGRFCKFSRYSFVNDVRSRKKQNTFNHRTYASHVKRLCGLCLFQLVKEEKYSWNFLHNFAKRCICFKIQHDFHTIYFCIENNIFRLIRSLIKRVWVLGLNWRSGLAKVTRSSSVFTSFKINLFSIQFLVCFVLMILSCWFLVHTPFLEDCRTAYTFLIKFPHSLHSDLLFFRKRHGSKLILSSTPVGTLHNL